MQQKYEPTIICSSRHDRLSAQERARLTHVGRGIYALPLPAHLNQFERAAARYHTQLAALHVARSEDCLFRGPSAAFIHDVPLLSTPDLIAYTRPSGSGHIGKPFTEEFAIPLMLLKEPDSPYPVNYVHNFNTVTAIQAMADCAIMLPRKEAIVAVSGLMRKVIGRRYYRSQDWAAIARRENDLRRRAQLLLPRMHGVNDHRAATRILMCASGRCETPYEAVTLAFLREWGFPLPLQQFRIEVDGKAYFIDFAWPQWKILLEFDGYIKTSIDTWSFHRAYHRDAVLTSQGWTVLHVTSEMLANEQELARLLRRNFPVRARRHIKG